MPASRRHLVGARGRCNTNSREGSAMWVCLLLGYLFMLRSNNYAAPDKSKTYNPLRLLRRCDITYYTGGLPKDIVTLTYANAHLIQRVVIHVRSTKTDQAGMGYSRQHWRTTNEDLCVVKALVHHQLLTQDLPMEWPIAAYDAKPGLGAAKCVISRTAISDLLKTVSMHLGEDMTNYSSHSLRIGGATAMYEVSGEKWVKWFGNWKSDTYLEYIRASSSHGRLFAQRMIEQDLYIYGEPSGHGVREPAQPRVGVRMASAF